VHELETIISNYGLVAVLVGALFEGETIVVIAGFAAHQGLLNPVGVVACAFVGSLSADQLFFSLAGHQSKRQFIVRLTHRPSFARALALVERYPNLSVLACRWLYGIRWVLPVAIAFTNISPVRFRILNAVSAACWATTFTAIGYFLGQTVEAVFGTLHGMERKALVAVAIAVLVLVVGRLIARRVVQTKLLKSPRESLGNRAETVGALKHKTSLNRRKISVSKAKS